MTPSPQPTCTSCIACEIISGKKEVPGGSLLRTTYFDVHQDYAVPIPGFIVLVPLRHVASIEHFTDDEASEFGLLLKKVRAALTTKLDISLVHIIQDENSPHFHAVILPRYEWMKEHCGEKVESVRPIMQFAKTHMNTPEQWQDVIDTTKEISSLLSL